MSTLIKDNLEMIRVRIAKAAERAGRKPSDIRLLAVSKTKPLEVIREAIAAGQLSFGENYVQEAVEKVASLPTADWHFIGSLQSNKVKQVVGRFSLVHSIDREKLAIEFSKIAVNLGLVQDILLQIHIGEEATKHGVDLESAPDVIRRIALLPGLRLRGVMSLPPLSDDESISRSRFADLRKAHENWRRDCLSERQALDFDQISMGTSSDFEWAILEGATIVRVGTSIFGSRETKSS